MPSTSQSISRRHFIAGSSVTTALSTISFAGPTSEFNLETSNERIVALKNINQILKQEVNPDRLEQIRKAYPILKSYLKKITKLSSLNQNEIPVVNRISKEEIKQIADTGIHHINYTHFTRKLSEEDLNEAIAFITDCLKIYEISLNTLSEKPETQDNKDLRDRFIGDLLYCSAYQQNEIKQTSANILKTYLISELRTPQDRIEIISKCFSTYNPRNLSISNFLLIQILDDLPEILSPKNLIFNKAQGEDLKSTQSNYDLLNAIYVLSAFTLNHPKIEGEIKIKLSKWLNSEFIEIINSNLNYCEDIFKNQKDEKSISDQINQGSILLNLIRNYKNLFLHMRSQGLVAAHKVESLNDNLDCQLSSICENQLIAWPDLLDKFPINSNSATSSVEQLLKLQIRANSTSTAYLRIPGMPVTRKREALIEATNDEFFAKLLEHLETLTNKMISVANFEIKQGEDSFKNLKELIELSRLFINFTHSTAYADLSSSYQVIFKQHRASECFFYKALNFAKNLII